MRSSSGYKTQRKWRNPWSANGLANLEVGRFPGRMVSYRFRAAETGRFVTAKVFLVFAVFGQGQYANGDGGQMRIELRPDDGSPDHLPDMSAAPLSATLLTDPLNETKGAPIWGSDSRRSPDPRAGGSFREIPFPPATLQEGRLYHLVFSDAYGWTAGNFKDGFYEYTTDGRTWQKVRGSRSFKQQLYFVTAAGKAASSRSSGN